MTDPLARFLRQTGPLPSLPAIYVELNAAISSPYSSIEDVGSIIRKDHSLTTRLLRLANSALYGLPRRIETLEEGLYVIGLREMCEMALATTVITTFMGLPVELADPVQFWRHSVACAVGCALLAEERSDPVPERLFVGGLLHDVGRMVLYLRAPDECARILKRCRETGELDTTVEIEVLGFDHAHLGAALLEMWSMPPSLVEMVRCHHAPTRTHGPSSETALVHVADFIANTLEFGSSGEFAVTPLSEEGWTRCRLNESRIRDVAHEIEARYEPLCEMLTDSKG
jgi:putative nucleotidyltransferase with HDIG domain